MTTKHLVNGLMQAVRAKNHNHCTQLLDLPQGTLCRMANGTHKNLLVSTLAHIHEKSRVPLDALVDWYLMPADQPLGRVTPKPVTINNRQLLLVHYEGPGA
jgi:uncharacterized protein YbaP (TraB family)